MVARSLGMLGVVALVFALPAVAEAQVIGTFGWQTQPYCNVIAVTVIQQGGHYQLTGTDNLCGAGTAPVTGTAVPAGGNVVLGITAALPSGRVAHVSAAISLGTLSGTWSDGDGNTGTFAFGANAGGAPRPDPAPSTAITVNQFAPSVYAGTGVAATVARSDHIHDDRYFTEAETTALLAAKSEPLEVVVTAGASPVTPDFSQTSVRTATTTRAGRLDVAMVFVFNVTCSSGSAVAYIAVDGVTLLSSLTPLQAGTAIVNLRGVTTTALPAGAHNIGFAVDCPSGTLGGSIGFPGAATVIVIP